MPSEMVERVARALCVADCLGKQTDEGWDAYLPDARAALEAMRDPTDAMSEKGTRYFWVQSDDFSKGWGELIDAALSDHKDTSDGGEGRSAP